MMRIEKVLVTPEHAATLLAEYNIDNRPYREKTVRLYAEDMRRDDWVPDTGDFIRFTKTKKIMVDGQHRLRAVILVDKTIELYFLHGVNDRSKDYIDQGVKRSAADTLSSYGVPNANTMASVIKASLNLRKTKAVDPINNYSMRPTNAMIVKEYFENKEYWEELRANASHCYTRMGSGVLSTSLIGAWIDAFNFFDELDSVEFWDSVSTGSGGENSPTYQLKDVLVKDRLNKHQRLTSRKKQALIIKSWNYYRAEREVRVLRWSPRELFPKPL
jgi:hypothetical protein